MATAVTSRSARSSKQQGLHSHASMAGTEAVGALQIDDENTPLNSNHKQAAHKAVNSSDWVLHAYSDPLVLESHTAFKALLIAPLVVWWVAIFLGMWVYEGLPKGQKVYHVMLWFDRGLLRPAGPLVPFAVLAARAVVHWAAHVSQHGCGSRGSRVAGQQQQQQHKKQAVLRLGSLLMPCLAIYSTMAVARLAIYLTHFFLLQNRYLEFHIVSDHIFLGATMLISLHAELLCLMSDMLRAVKASGPFGDAVSWREAVLTLLFVVALFLYLFTVADMYYTAKYFHFPMESFFTTLLVFVLFQLPMLVWIVRQRRVK